MVYTCTWKKKKEKAVLGVYLGSMVYTCTWNAYPSCGTRFTCLNYCITVCLYVFAAKGVVVQWYIHVHGMHTHHLGARFTCLNYCIYCITVCLYLFAAKGVVVQWYIHVRGKRKKRKLFWVYILVQWYIHVHGMHTHHLGVRFTCLNYCIYCITVCLYRSALS